MPELRKDPITGRWVIISTERGSRPSSFQHISVSEDARLCPFCPGHESNTPPEVLAYRPSDTEPDQPGWTLRVISNKYPALRVEGTINREPQGLYDRMTGIGAHEVIIETPVHGQDMVSMSVDAVRDVLWAYRERMIDLQRDRRLKHILIFKNHGEAAGASLEHAHSQLIATPIIPKVVMEEIEGSHRYWEYKERCIFCDIVRQELSEGERMVCDYDAFIAFEPFASRFPFETWLIPKTHQSSFLEMHESEFTVLAKAMKDTLRRLSQALNDPPFNYILHTRPVSDEHHEYYHWHFEIIPKLTKVAGFEWGSGFYINHTAPEDAAQYLRSLQVDEVDQEPKQVDVEKDG